MRNARSRVGSGPILGNHPSISHPFGKIFSSKDGTTASKIPHRVLFEIDGERAVAAISIAEMLIRHHASAEALKRSEEQCEAMKRLGVQIDSVRLRRFPTNPSTRKGNLAEVVLAEYVVAASGLSLPVYRLRYNPNVDQSMKGDDVLAFDLDADPVRIVVGEAKFRAASSADAVKEIVEGLVRSHKAGVPASLQFVADRLFEEGQADLGRRVCECAIQIAREKLRLDYIGLLLSDSKGAERVNEATPGALRHLAMISLSFEDPNSFVDACYQNLD